MAYRADIEIGVKGTRQLEQLRSEINKTSVAAQSLIDVLGDRGRLVQNIQNYQNQLNKAANSLSLVTAGTKAETKAIDEYVTALGRSNTAQQRQQILIDTEIKKRQELARIQKLTAAGVFETTRFKQPIGPQISPLQGQSSPVNERIARTIAGKKEQRQLDEALLKLEIKSAAIANEKLRAEKELGLATLRNVNARKLELAGPQFPMAGPMGLGAYGQGRKPTGGGKGGGLGKTAAGALSNAAVGGAFPLLFGQSGAASAGGAIGGIAGSLIPGVGGFGGSLIGTIIGEKAGQGNKVKELAADIGFSAEQTKMLGIAFQQAGRDFDKFQQSVSTIQGLSLSIEDQGRAIQLASSLTESYGGKIDKVTNALAGALSTGKVTQGTLNQLTNNGIEIQQALADKYNVSRSAIIQMAKDGEISVQDLIDTLVEVGNEAEKAGAKQADSFAAAGEAIGTATTNLNTALAPAYAYVTEEVAKLIQKIADLTTGTAAFITYSTPALGTVINAFDGINTAIGNAALNLPNLSVGVSSFAQAAYISLLPVAALVDYIAKQGKGPGFLGAGKYAAPENQIRTPEPLKTFKAPSQAAPSGGGKGDNAAEKAAKAAEREAARVANIVRDQAAITEQKKLQAQYNQGLFLAEIAKDEVLKIQIEREQKIGELSLQYSKQINDEKAKGNSAAAKEAFTRTALADVQLVELSTAQQLKKLELDRAEQYANTLVDLQYELDLKNAVTEQERTRLQIAYEVAKLEQDKSKGLDAEQIAKIKSRKEQIAAPKTDQETIQQRVGALKDELTELASLSNLVITGADAIGTAFATSFRGIISGTMTAQEALASFFQSIADAFLDMAAQIIAKWITLTILNSVLALFPGGGGGGGKGLGQLPMDDISRYAVPLPGFAEGGYVTGPTNAIVGEGGQPEYVIPASKMRDSMNRYAAGARGSAVLAGGDMGSDAGGGTATMAPSAIDVRYTVERINTVDYVTADQFQAGMRQAASQGAKQGERLTLNNLRQNTATRRRVGI